MNVNGLLIDLGYTLIILGAIGLTMIVLLLLGKGDK